MYKTKLIIFFVGLVFLTSPFSFSNEKITGNGFIYKGKIYSLHGSFDKKGEGLRAFVKENPIALTYLDKYQSNHQKSLTAAYTGTIGLLIFVAATVFADTNSDKSKVKDTRMIGFGVGGAIALGGLFMTTKYLLENQSNLDMAVEEFNKTSKDKIIMNAEQTFLGPKNIPIPE